MPNASKTLSFRIFADDTNVFYSCDSINELETVMNEEFQLLLKYCTINKLSINLKKTHFLVITSSKRKVKKISISDIEQRSYVKYLGVYLDEFLNWDYQIKHVNAKINKNLGIISKLRYYIDLKMLKQLYYTIIYPYLNYGIMSWGNTYSSKLTKLCTKQNKCIRSIFFANCRENASCYYRLLEVLKFENIFKLRIAIMSYRIAYKKKGIPSIFLDFLSLASSMHSYNTRFASKLNFVRPKVRSNYGIHTFKYISSKIWEDVPLSIKNSESLNIFKRKYKLFLLSGQV